MDDRYLSVSQISSNIRVTYDPQEKRHLAMKKVNIDMEQMGIPVSTLREISALRCLRHQNIVKLLDVVMNPNSVYIIYETFQNSLSDVINEELDTKFIMKQLVEGVHACHKARIIHRDINPSNILVDPEYNLKLSNFEEGRVIQTVYTLTPGVQTLWYRSPELLLGEKYYTFAIDMWSVGCVFAELLLKRPLFRGNNPLDQLSKICQLLGTPSEQTWKNVSKFDFFNSCMQFPRQFNLLNIGDVEKDLLGRMLEMNPGNRISAKEALKHPYFNN